MKIDIKGIDSLIGRLKRYENIDEKLAEVTRRLVEIGEPIIQAVHGSNNKVTIGKTANGYQIVAEGETVLFLEFGTGDAAGREADKYDAVPSVVRPGSWSETHARQYSRYGFWIFGGQKYTETAPNPAFYDAYIAMVDALPQIAKEVFGE